MSGTDVWAPGRGPLFFVSHAFDNPFQLLVDSLLEHFRDRDPRDVFLWLVRDAFVTVHVTPLWTACLEHFRNRDPRDVFLRRDT